MKIVWIFLYILFIVHIYMNLAIKFVIIFWEIQPLLKINLDNGLDLIVGMLVSWYGSHYTPRVLAGGGGRERSNSLKGTLRVWHQSRNLYLQNISTVCVAEQAGAVICSGSAQNNVWSGKGETLADIW